MSQLPNWMQGPMGSAILNALRRQQRQPPQQQSLPRGIDPVYPREYEQRDDGPTARQRLREDMQPQYEPERGRLDPNIMRQMELPRHPNYRTFDSILRDSFSPPEMNSRRMANGGRTRRGYATDGRIPEEPPDFGGAPPSPTELYSYDSRYPYRLPWQLSEEQKQAPWPSINDKLFIDPLSKLIEKVTPESKLGAGPIKPMVDPNTGETMRTQSSEVPFTREERARNLAEPAFHTMAAMTRLGMLASLPGNLQDLSKAYQENDIGGMFGVAAPMAGGMAFRNTANRFRPPSGLGADINNQLFGGYHLNPLSPRPSFAPAAGWRGYGDRVDPMWPRKLEDLSDRTYQLHRPGTLRTGAPSFGRQVGDWFSSHDLKSLLPRQTLDIVKYEGHKVAPIGTVTLRRRPNSSFEIEGVNLQGKNKVNQEMIDDITSGAGNVFRWRHKALPQEIGIPINPAIAPQKSVGDYLSPSRIEMNPKTREVFPFQGHTYNETPAPAPRPVSREANPEPPVSPLRTAPHTSGRDEEWRKLIGVFGGEQFIPGHVRELFGRKSGGGRVGFERGGYVAYPYTGSRSDLGPYDTRLREGDERQYPAWKRTFAPNDSGQDYDYRGAFKARVRPDPQSGHWPDTFKKPNHPTFSDQSQYARDPNVGYAAGRWQGDNFVPSQITSPYADGGSVQMSEALTRRHGSEVERPFWS